MTDNCNSDTIAQARANVAATLHQPYNQRAVLAGEWDGGMLVQAEVERLLKQPVIAEGGE